MTVAPDRRKVVWSLACLFDMPLLLEVEDCSDLSFVSGFTNLGEVFVFFWCEKLVSFQSLLREHSGSLSAGGPELQCPVFLL